MAEVTISGSGQGQQTISVTAEHPVIFVDTKPEQIWHRIDYCLYNHNYELEDPLGSEFSQDTDTNNGRRCFNCGSSEHAVSACPEPYNHALVTLSRQLYNFFKSSDGQTGPFYRLHEVEEWRRLRVEWLETFEPGRIVGRELREALGLEGEDEGKYVPWLERIAAFGYPPGWVGVEDPRLQVWKTVTKEGVPDTNEAGENVEVFVICGEEGEETVDLPPTTIFRSNLDNVPQPFVDVDEEVGSYASTPTLSSRSSTPDPTQTSLQLKRRWATYPNTYFSSELLPVYAGQSLPPIVSELNHSDASSTFDAEREALWRRITSQENSVVHPIQRETVPPWRLAGAFSLAHPLDGVNGGFIYMSRSESPPPPPPTEPPPLPPSPCPPAEEPPPPPLLPAYSMVDDLTVGPTADGLTTLDESKEESDMELSDSDIE